MKLLINHTWLETKFINLLNISVSHSQLLQIQTQIILHKLTQNTTVISKFIEICRVLNSMKLAFHLFDNLPNPHLFICNSLMRAFAHTSCPQNSILVYIKTLRNSISPNNFTFPFVLKSCSDLKLVNLGQTLHSQIVKTGHESDLFVQNSLLNLYSSCGDLEIARQLFDEMAQRDAVSWTVMVTGHRKIGRFDDSLLFFERMQFSGVTPNRVTMVNALSACASSGSLEMGVWIHEFIKRELWELDVILGTSLVDMYGKCGKIEMGLRIFESMTEKNVYTWNALINGLALAKNGAEAMSWFLRMEEHGIKPDEVTLIGVLCACSHSGLVEMGRRIFESMAGKYGISPGIKHYGCMVDLLGRAGFLEEARRFTERMPFEPNAVIWGALLGGSRAHGDLLLSEFAARSLVELDPLNGAYYAVLSNLYAQMGRWSDVEELRRLMKERGIQKDLGSSSLQEHNDFCN